MVISGAGFSRAALRRRYRLALAALNEEQRQVFELHAVHNRSIAQIAADMGATTDAVERLLALALVGIARALDADRR